jgi:hypothetical protein
MEHLGQPQGFYRSAMEHLSQPQGTWISYGTLGSASRFLDQPWNTYVSLKDFRAAIKHLGQSWQTQGPWGWPSCFMAKMRLLGQPRGSWVCHDWPKWSMADLKTLRLTQVFHSWSKNLEADPGASWLRWPKCSMADLKTLRLTKVFKISYGTLGSALRYLNQLWIIWVSVKVLRLAMKHSS